MRVFRASNGVTIRFKVRDCPRNFYMIGEPGQPERELQINDDGMMRRCCDDPIPQSWRDAYVEFVRNELEEYAEWRSNKPYLLPESEDDGTCSLRRKLALAVQNQTLENRHAPCV